MLRRGLLLAVFLAAAGPALPGASAEQPQAAAKLDVSNDERWSVAEYPATIVAAIQRQEPSSHVLADPDWYTWGCSVLGGGTTVRTICSTPAGRMGRSS